jgi:hypothetical protein
VKPLLGARVAVFGQHERQQAGEPRVELGLPEPVEPT